MCVRGVDDVNYVTTVPPPTWTSLLVSYWFVKSKWTSHCQFVELVFQTYGFVMVGKILLKLGV
jgi:hypothetical protein